MALTPDQEAMLQLLLERGQSYGDLASLLGVDEAEVRRRARAALISLAGEDPDRNVGLTDWLLGQADPIGRADAVRHLRDDPDDHRLASKLLERLREVSPQGELPRLPGEPGRGRRGRRVAAVPAAAPQPAAATGGAGGSGPALGARRGLPGAARLPRPTTPSLSGRQARLLVVLGSAAVILIVVVLAIAGAFSGGGEEATSTTPTTTTAAAGEQSTPVPLRAQGGSDASGSATIGVANASNPYVDLQVRGAPPAPEGQVYVLWFLTSEDQGFPIPASIPVKNGRFSDRLSLPPGVLPFVQQSRFLDLSLVDAKELRGGILEALQTRQGTVQYQGRSILRGAVPGQPSGG